MVTPRPGTPRPSDGVLAGGIRWLTSAAILLVLAAAGVGLRGSDGPRPVPLLLAAVVVAGIGLWRRRQRPAGPAGTAALVVASALLLLAAEAWLRPDRDGLEVFLLGGGALLVGVGLLLDDRRPVALGALQWVGALLLPASGADRFRHCLVATDLSLPHVEVLPVALLGAGLLAAAVGGRRAVARADAVRGAEAVGLGALLAGLAAKALELPGHPALCGAGDAVDTGWAALLLVVAAAVGVAGVRWRDPLWSGGALAAATLFAAAASVLERTPAWALLVGVPAVAVVVVADARGVVRPRHTRPPGGAETPPTQHWPVDQHPTPCVEAPKRSGGDVNAPPEGES